MCQLKDIINNSIGIVLITYSCIATIVTVLLILYIIKLKTNARYSVCCGDEKIPEDQEPLNSTSIVNASGNDTMSHRLYRTRSVPINSNKNKRFSEYDSVACTSRPAPKMEPSVVHHNEKMQTPQRSEGTQCKIILEDVSTALTAAKRASCENNDLYRSFFNALLNNIKMKDPDLYESIQCSESKHTYEKIDEVKKSNFNMKFNRSSGDESTYAIYMPSLSGKLVNVVNSNEFSENETSSDSSDDERFQKRSRSEENTPSEVRRLRAKEELLKLSCHEDLPTRRTDLLPRPSINPAQIPYNDADLIPRTGSTDPARSASFNRSRDSNNPPEIPPKMSRRQNRNEEDTL